jgi:hypothetical protein
LRVKRGGKRQSVLFTFLSAFIPVHGKRLMYIRGTKLIYRYKLHINSPLLARVSVRWWFAFTMVLAGNFIGRTRAKQTVKCAV